MTDWLEACVVVPIMGDTILVTVAKVQEKGTSRSLVIYVEAKKLGVAVTPPMAGR
ncbi:MAG TPA: hypothetical protein ACQGQH_02525 [Xylella sp.]